MDKFQTKSESKKKGETEKEVTEANRNQGSGREREIHKPPVPTRTLLSECCKTVPRCSYDLWGPQVGCLPNTKQADTVLQKNYIRATEITTIKHSNMNSSRTEREAQDNGVIIQYIKRDRERDRKRSTVM